LLAAGFLFGLVLALVYKYAKRNEVYSKAIPFSILILAPAMAALIGLVNARNSEIEASTAVRVGLVVSCGIALTRFRSDPIKADDLVYIVLSTLFGLVLGLGYVAYGAIALTVFSFVLLLIGVLRFGENRNHIMSLRIQVPEALNWEDAFEAPLKKYCLSHKLVKTKTVDYGQLYEVTFDLTLNKGASGKQLVDEVRALNGNLQIVLSDACYKE
jgi:hypothetical protein